MPVTKAAFRRHLSNALVCEELDSGEFSVEGLVSESFIIVKETLGCSHDPPVLTVTLKKFPSNSI